MRAIGSARNLTRGSLIAGRLETGRSLWQRFLGLMGRDALPASGGLWLPGTSAIHMLFMRFPIDCVFLSGPAAGSRRVVGVRRALRPWVSVVWYVRGANGVLELPVGSLDESGTQAGDLVILEGVDPPVT